MAFRVLAFTDSQPVFQLLHAAFDEKLIAVQQVPAELWSDNTQALESYLRDAPANVIVTAFVGEFAQGSFLGQAPAFGQDSVDDNSLSEQHPCIEKIAKIVEHCQAQSLPLIHISSYGVFGCDQTACLETLPAKPDDAVGEYLLAIEQAVLALPQSIVLRRPWMMTHDQGALLEIIAEAFLSHAPVIASEDARGALSSWQDLAQAVVAITQQVLAGAQNWGVFHLCSSDRISEAEFADAVMRLLKTEGYSASELITVKGQARITRRECLLEGRRCTNNFGIQQRSFRQSLRNQLQQWLAQQGYLPEP